MESLVNPNRQIALWIFIIFLLTLPVFACSSAEGGDVMLDEKSDGSSVELSLGNNLIISLASNPSTGYAWGVLEMDPTILEKIGGNEFAPPEGTEIAPGSGGREQLTFNAISKGTTTLKLGYKRPWEDQAQPEKLFSVEITVK